MTKGRGRRGRRAENESKGKPAGNGGQVDGADGTRAESWEAFCEAMGRKSTFQPRRGTYCSTRVFRLGHVKLAHKLLGVDIGFDAPRMRATGKGAKKTWAPSRKQGVRLATGLGEKAMARAVVLACTFLMRVGDGCVPSRMAGPRGGAGEISEHSQAAVANEMVKKVLKTRKNRPRGSVLERRRTSARSKWLRP